MKKIVVATVIVLFGAFVKFYFNNIYTKKIVVNYQSRMVAADSEIFPDENFYNCIVSDDEYGNGIENIEKLTCINKGISDLTGLDKLTSLVNLNIGSNNISSIDLSGNKKLAWVELAYNNISSIDNVKNVPASLRSISLKGNKLTGSVDVSKSWENNKLTTLNLSGNNIVSLSCSFINSLSNLIIKEAASDGTVYTMPDLYSLNISGTSISSMDLSGAPKLERLYASSIHIMDSLVINSNTNLKTLNIANNEVGKSINFDDNDLLENILIDAKYANRIDFSSTNLPNLKTITFVDYDVITTDSNSYDISALSKHFPSNLSVNSDYIVKNNTSGSAKETISSSVNVNSAITSGSGEYKGYKYLSLLVEGDATINGVSAESIKFNGYYDIVFNISNGSNSQETTGVVTNNPKTGSSLYYVILLLLVVVALSLYFYSKSKFSNENG